MKAAADASSALLKLLSREECGDSALSAVRFFTICIYRILLIMQSLGKIDGLSDESVYRTSVICDAAMRLQEIDFQAALGRALSENGFSESSADNKDEFECLKRFMADAGSMINDIIAKG